MLDAIRKELAMATVEPTGGQRSLSGKWCDPVNKTPQALILQVQDHLEVSPVDVFGTNVDTMEAAVDNDDSKVYVILNPRSAAYDRIGTAISRLKLAPNNSLTSDEGGATVEVCRCSPDHVSTLVTIIRGLDPVKGAKDIQVLANQRGVSLRILFRQLSTSRAEARLRNTASSVKDTLAGIRVYEAHPAYTIKNRL